MHRVIAIVMQRSGATPPAITVHEVLLASYASQDEAPACPFSAFEAELDRIESLTHGDDEFIVSGLGEFPTGLRTGGEHRGEGSPALLADFLTAHAAQAQAA